MELVKLALTLISIGIFFMLAATIRTGAILKEIKGKTESNSWRILFFMMIFIIGGYLTALYLIFTEEQKLVAGLTGVIVLVGAVFVFIITRVSSHTINSLITKDKSDELNIALKENEIKIKQKSKELELANIELSEDRKQLEDRVTKRTSELAAVNFKLTNEIEEHKKAEQELVENKNRLERQNKALQKVTKCFQIDNKNLAQTIFKVTEIASETIGVERLSIWLYDEPKTSMRCIDLFELSKKNHSEGLILSSKKFPAYFKALESNRIIDANDAHTDLRTYEYSESYLTPLGITSMLDAPLRRTGLMIGVVCFEHVGPKRTWTLDEQLFAGAIADSVSILLESFERMSVENNLQKKEQQLSSIYDTVGDIIFVLSAEKEERYKFVSVNKAFEETTGLKFDQVVGKYVSEVIPQPSLNIVLEKYKKAIVEKKIIRWEETSDYPTGQLIGEVSISPIFDDNGNCTQLVGAVHDITDRKNAETKIRKLNDELEERVKERTVTLTKTQESLRLSEEKYREIVEQAGDCVYSSDYNGYLTYINPMCKKLTGYNENEFIGKHFLEIIDPEWKEKVEKFYKDQFDNRVGETLFSFPIITKSGEKKWVEQIVSQQKNGDLITGHKAIIRDITQRKINEDLIKKKSEELEISNKDLAQFVYIASHDLQEPLRMVNSYLQLLEKRYKDKLDNDAVDFINYAVDGSNRMKTLILSLLDYSRINNSQPFEKIDLNELLKEILVSLSKEIKQNNATISIDQLPVIYGDKVLIIQLFENLISNSLKFRGEKVPEIYITGIKNLKEFLFSFKDNGIGIQKEYVGKLFTVFQRLNSKEHYPGAGIGLAICKKIVEKHGGKIWVESEFGKGTTFYFTIKEFEESAIEEENKNAEIKREQNEYAY